MGDLRVLGENQKSLIGTMPCAISSDFMERFSICMSPLCPLPFSLALPSPLLPLPSSSFPFLSVHSSPFPLAFFIWGHGPASPSSYLSEP